jgi:hypothetical protein
MEITTVDGATTGALKQELGAIPFVLKISLGSTEMNYMYKRN